MASLEKQTRCYEVWGEEAQIFNITDLEEKHPKNGPIYPIRNAVRTELSTQVDKEIEHDAILKIAELANNASLYTTDGVVVVSPEQDALTVLIEGEKRDSVQPESPQDTGPIEELVSSKEDIELLLDEVHIAKEGLIQILATHGRGKNISAKMSSLHKNITHKTWDKNGRHHDLVRVLYQSV